MNISLFKNNIQPACNIKTKILGINNNIKFKPVQDSFECNSVEGFYLKFKNKLKALVTDKQGNFIYRQPDKTELVPIKSGTTEMYIEKVIGKGDVCKFNFDKEYKPLNEAMGILEHGTSEKSFNEIKKNGFSVGEGFAETFHGVYLTRKVDGANHYGEKQLQCRLKGNAATGNIDYISDFLFYPTAIDDYIEKNNLKFDAHKLKEMLLKDEFKNRGFDALYSDRIAPFAKCKSVVVFDPKNLEILN